MLTLAATSPFTLARAYAQSPNSQAPAPLGATATPSNAPAGFADLAAKVTPAVVNISATEKPAAPEAMAEQPDAPDLPSGTPFDEFLRRFFQEQQQRQHNGRPDKVIGQGSGFIIDPAGYVVTNNHVAGNAVDITVTLPSGEKFPAKLIGKDEKTDLALLKIDANHPLPYIAWGDSDKVRVGDWVVAIGNPFGLGGSVTAGILSARGRDINSGPFDDFLQIDAPINRGNSGGPSFDMNGNVIGINTAIYSPSGGSVGIGFAIPSKLAKPVIDELRQKGRIDRGWLGVQIQEVTPEIAQSLGMPKEKGALVARIEPNSPAAKAGLKTGDVVVGVNGTSVDRLKDLPRLVAEQPAGQKVDLAILRGGRSVAVPVVVAKAPSDQVAAAGDHRRNGDAGQSDSLGLALAPITPETKQRFGLADDAEGVVITAIKRDSDAAQQGLRPGDVITQVNDHRVGSPADVATEVKAAEQAGRDRLLVLVGRQQQERFVALKLGRA
jgi:serine protease Do